MLVVALTCLRHLELFFSLPKQMSHFHNFLIPAFKKIDKGRWFIKGPEFGNTGFFFGGGLYYWLHLPARLLSNPVYALHGYYCLLECLALLLWLRLSRRGPLQREEVWIAAALVGLYPESKMMITENTSVAIYFSTVLFGVVLWAQGTRRARAMLLAGVCTGLTMHIHFMAVVLVGPIALWLIPDSERSLRWTRALWLLVGVLLTTVPFIGQYHVAEDGRVGELLGTFWRIFTFQTYFDYLRQVLEDPLPLLGVVLIAVSWVRRREVNPGRKLAMFWFLGFDLALPFLLAIRNNPVIRFDFRFGLANPARGVLTAGVLLWLLGGAGSIWTYISWILRRREASADPTATPPGEGEPPQAAPRRAPQILISLVLLGSALAGLAAITHSMVHAYQTAPPPIALRIGQTKGDCSTLKGIWDHRALGSLVEAIHQNGWPPARPGAAEIIGPGSEKLEAAYYWFQTSGMTWLGLDRIPEIPEEWLLVMPGFTGLSQSRVAGVQDYGSFLIVPGWTLLDHAKGDDWGERMIRLPPKTPADGILALSIHTRGTMDEAEATIEVRQNSIPLRPIFNRLCYSDRAISMIKLYRLDPGRKGSVVLVKDTQDMDVNTDLLVAQPGRFSFESPI